MVAMGGGDGYQMPLIIGGVLLAGFLLYLWRGRIADRKEREAAKEHEVNEKTAPKTRFSDVAGCSEAVEELAEVVEFLNNPERFEKLGAKLPRGAVLIGPPGTGKTLLARAVAGEAGVSFFHHAGSDFVELYVGAGAKRIRELYAKAKEVGRAIVFIDEIDAIGKKRSNSPTATGSNEEQEHTLIALLNELDGFTESGVFTIAATNRPDVLDPALTRPGRLEKKISVPAPDRVGREHILRVHAAGKPLTTDVDLAGIARRTPGMSGADLAALVNEAALEAARARRESIDTECFEKAVANISMGRARSSAYVTDQDRRITAWHEAGHTVMARVLPEASNPAAVSIIPRGAAGGVTWMEGSDNLFMTTAAAKARLAVALGGRAAEELHLGGECTQGAQADLAAATELANAMVRQFGMTERGLTARTAGAFDPYDAATADAVEALLSEAMETARETLRWNMELLEKTAAALLERGTLHGEDLDNIFGSARTRPRGAEIVNRVVQVPERTILVSRRRWAQRVIEKLRRQPKKLA
jgi:cell division protease FtsH